MSQKQRIFLFITLFTFPLVFQSSEPKVNALITNWSFELVDDLIHTGYFSSLALK